jgi:hypothetical protein
LQELPEHLRWMTMLRSLWTTPGQCALCAGARSISAGAGMIHAHEAKPAGDRRAVKRSRGGCAAGAAGKNAEYVFTFGKKHPRQLDQVNTRAWREALKRADRQPTRSLRRLGSWSKMNGVGDRELMGLAAGNPRRWSVVMRICRRSIWRHRRRVDRVCRAASPLRCLPEPGL